MNAIAKEAKNHNLGRLLELLFAHVVDSIFLTQADGQIIDANPAACTMLGYGREELLGMRPWDFVTSASRDEILALIGGMKHGVTVTLLQTYRRKSGEIRTMNLRLTRFGCPDRELIAASCRDLTEQKQLEEQVRDLSERRRAEESSIRLNRELERRIVERTADLERTNRALQAEIEERKKVEEALHHSEDDLRLAIDTIPTSLSDGHIEYLNKRWLEYTGMR